MHSLDTDRIMPTPAAMRLDLGSGPATRVVKAILSALGREAGAVKVRAVDNTLLRAIAGWTMAPSASRRLDGPEWQQLCSRHAPNLARTRDCGERRGGREHGLDEGNRQGPNFAPHNSNPTGFPISPQLELFRHTWYRLEGQTGAGVRQINDATFNWRRPGDQNLSWDIDRFARERSAPFDAPVPRRLTFAKHLQHQFSRA